MVATLPFDHFKPPRWRELEAEREAAREIYEAGGMYRGAPLLLLGAILSNLPPEQFGAIVTQLERMTWVREDDANAKAALTFARQCAPLRPSPEKEA